MVPLYATRVEDLGPGDYVKVECAACGHVELLVPDQTADQGARAPALHAGAGP